jgi:hypothetical protein
MGEVGRMSTHDPPIEITIIANQEFESQILLAEEIAKEQRSRCVRAP